MSLLQLAEKKIIKQTMYLMSITLIELNLCPSHVHTHKLALRTKHVLKNIKNIVFKSNLQIQKGLCKDYVYIQYI